MNPPTLRVRSAFSKNSVSFAKSILYKSSSASISITSTGYSKEIASRFAYHLSLRYLQKSAQIAEMSLKNLAFLGLSLVSYLRK